MHRCYENVHACTDSVGTIDMHAVCVCMYRTHAADAVHSAEYGLYGCRLCQTQKTLHADTTDTAVADNVDTIDTANVHWTRP